METQQAGDACEEILVERNDGGERLAGLRIAQPQPMFAGRISYDDVTAFDAGLVRKQRADRARIDCGGGLEPVRRGIEDDRDGG